MSFPTAEAYLRALGTGSGSLVVQQTASGTWPLRATVTTDLTAIVEWLPYSIALQTSTPPPTTPGYAQGRDRWAVLT